MKKNKNSTNVCHGGQPLLNKGFTLIELLAVIVILAIIALIAVPIILNIIKETKEKSYDISVDNIVKAANLYDIRSQLNDTAILMDQNIYEDLKKNLNGSVPDDGIVYLKSSLTGEKREIAFALKYGEWCYTKAYGDPSYEKKKTDNCNVPFDYLFVDSKLSSYLSATTGPQDLFLWRDEDTTKAIKREQIESIEIKPSDKVSESAIYSWDVSENKTGKVMAWYEDADNNGLYEAYIGQNGGVKTRDNVQYLFSFLSYAKTINLKYLDTSQVTQMRAMFYNNNNLIKLDISNFDTSKVGTDKNKIGGMNLMFSGCSKLEQLDLSNFNTENVTNMNSMFAGCSSLKSLDVSSFDTIRVTNMTSMFKDCSNLSNLNLSSFNTKEVETMNEMFNGCKKIININFGLKFITNNVNNMAYMFQSCNNLKSLDVSNFNTENVTNMNNMFSGCISLKSLDVSNFNTSNTNTIAAMFYKCENLENLDLSNFDTNKVKDAGMKELFYECINITSIKFGKNFDTSNVKDMSYMFYRCENLESLNLSNFNTSSVENMSNMFQNCQSLTSLDLSNFNTTNVKNMRFMFAGLIDLENLNMNNFNTANVENMEHMFNGCGKLTNLDIKGFNTNKVMNMKSIFQATRSLSNIKIGCGWVTSTNNADMFSNSKYTLEQFNTLVEQTQATCSTT